MSEKKFTEQELKSLKDLQEGYLKVQAKFGQLAIAKMTLQRQAEELGKTEESVKNDFGKLQKQEQDLVDELTDKYGEGSLDPSTGVFTSQQTTDSEK